MQIVVVICCSHQYKDTNYTISSKDHNDKCVIKVIEGFNPEPLVNLLYPSDVVSDIDQLVDYVKSRLLDQKKPANNKDAVEGNSLAGQMTDYFNTYVKDRLAELMNKPLQEASDITEAVLTLSAIDADFTKKFKAIKGNSVQDLEDVVPELVKSFSHLLQVIKKNVTSSLSIKTVRSIDMALKNAKSALQQEYPDLDTITLALKGVGDALQQIDWEQGVGIEMKKAYNKLKFMQTVIIMQDNGVFGKDVNKANIMSKIYDKGSLIRYLILNPDIVPKGQTILQFLDSMGLNV
jgi:hypothetical protein